MFTQTAQIARGTSLDFTIDAVFALQCSLIIRVFSTHTICAFTFGATVLPHITDTAAGASNIHCHLSHIALNAGIQEILIGSFPTHGAIGTTLPQPKFSWNAFTADDTSRFGRVLSVAALLARRLLILIGIRMQRTLHTIALLHLILVTTRGACGTFGLTGTFLRKAGLAWCACFCFQLGFV